MKARGPSPFPYRCEPGRSLCPRPDLKRRVLVLSDDDIAFMTSPTDRIKNVLAIRERPSSLRCTPALALARHVNCAIAYLAVSLGAKPAFTFGGRALG